MEDWRLWNAVWAADSEAWLRETVMSTMLPEEMEGGSRMEGNSIWRAKLTWRFVNAWKGMWYESFVLCEEDGDTGVDFADSEGD